MKYGHLFGYGIVIYSVMFLLWSGFVTYGFVEGLVPRLVSLSVLITLGIIAGNSLRTQSWRDIAPYSLAWALIAAALDAIFSVPFTGWSLFADWNVWLGYAIVALAPLAAPWFRRRTALA
ncbi:MAG: hypothetical protein HYS26_03325 [Candidatus Kaiserbacteria bacterium]|nr:MAG: hypothetical protein HYS26_03325 [Candidatus Kaiserbacteria bacterium]